MEYARRSLEARTVEPRAADVHSKADSAHLQQAWTVGAVEVRVGHNLVIEDDTAASAAIYHSKRGVALIRQLANLYDLVADLNGNAQVFFRHAIAVRISRCPSTVPPPWEPMPATIKGSHPRTLTCQRWS
jgi:hypothetical protein